MPDTNKYTFDFLFPTPLSLRAISQNWVNTRAKQIPNEQQPGEPNVQAALDEAVDRILERIGHNLNEEKPGTIYAPDNDTDPYIVCIPLNNLTGRLKRSHVGLEKGVLPTQIKPDVVESTLQDEFEDLLFQDLMLEQKVLDKDEQGKYKTSWVNARWEGFQMYHRHLTIAGKPAFKNRYNRTLGRYVVGQVGHQGKVVFTRVPFRHPTRASAMEEANRVAAEQQQPFAVFRCLDIIDLT